MSGRRARSSAAIWTQAAGLLLAGLTLAGCAFDEGNFTVLSTKNCEISRIDLKTVNFRRDVEGSDGRAWFLFIPLGALPNFYRAADDCLRQGNGDFMTSARTSYFCWSVLLVSWESERVLGDVGNAASAGARDVATPSAPVQAPAAGPTIPIQPQSPVVPVPAATPVEQATPTARRFCRDCGAALKPDAQFCPSCGKAQK